jgi:hypothetical protein
MMSELTENTDANSGHRRLNDDHSSRKQWNGSRSCRRSQSRSPNRRVGSMRSSRDGENSFSDKGTRSRRSQNRSRSHSRDRSARDR